MSLHCRQILHHWTTRETHISEERETNAFINLVRSGRTEASTNMLIQCYSLVGQWWSWRQRKTTVSLAASSESCSDSESFKSLSWNSSSLEWLIVTYWSLTTIGMCCEILKAIIICTVFRGRWNPAFMIIPSRATVKTYGLTKRIFFGSGILSFCNWYLRK